jgi:VWFA-related protein
VVCSALLFCAHSSAQQANQTVSPGSQIKIQVSVNAVLIPVVVRDSHGRAVGNLKKEDFQLFDRGKPQPISGFTIQKRATPEPEAKHSEAASSTPTVPAPPLVPPSASPQQRSIVFLFDDLHLSPSDLAQVQAAWTRMLAGTPVDSDLADVVSFTGINSGMTHDRAKLQEAVRKLRSHDLYHHAGRECPDVDYYLADLIQNRHDSQAFEGAVQDTLTCANVPPAMRNIAEQMVQSAASRSLTVGDQDVRVTLGLISDIVRKMAALPGQRSLILVSPGFLAISAEAMTLKSRIMDFAAQSNVTVSALDARGLYTTNLDATERGEVSAYGLATGQAARNHSDSMTINEDVMSELADGTGGTFFHNSNDLQAGFQTLTAGPEYLYLLELSLDNVKPNGAFHRLNVKVDRDGLKLQARHGYFAPMPAKIKN